MVLIRHGSKKVSLLFQIIIKPRTSGNVVQMFWSHDFQKIFWIEILVKFDITERNNFELKTILLIVLCVL